MYISLLLSVIMWLNAQFYWECLFVRIKAIQECIKNASKENCVKTWIKYSVINQYGHGHC